MPSTTSDAQYHAYWEQDTPYCSLEEHVYPKYGVDRSVHLLFREFIVMGVSCGREYTSRQSQYYRQHLVDPVRQGSSPYNKLHDVEGKRKMLTGRVHRHSRPILAEQRRPLISPPHTRLPSVVADDDGTTAFFNIHRRSNHSPTMMMTL